MSLCFFFRCRLRRRTIEILQSKPCNSSRNVFSVVSFARRLQLKSERFLCHFLCSTIRLQLKFFFVIFFSFFCFTVSLVFLDGYNSSQFTSYVSFPVLVGCNSSRTVFFHVLPCARRLQLKLIRSLFGFLCHTVATQVYAFSVSIPVRDGYTTQVETFFFLCPSLFSTVTTQTRVDLFLFSVLFSSFDGYNSSRNVTLRVVSCA